MRFLDPYGPTGLGSVVLTDTRFHLLATSRAVTIAFGEFRNPLLQKTPTLKHVQMVRPNITL